MNHRFFLHIPHLKDMHVLNSRSSSQIPVGAQAHKNRPTEEVERFLLSIRFENREKLEKLGLKL